MLTLSAERVREEQPPIDRLFQVKQVQDVVRRKIEKKIYNAIENFRFSFARVHRIFSHLHKCDINNRPEYELGMSRIDLF